MKIGLSWSQLVPVFCSKTFEVKNIIQRYFANHEYYFSFFCFRIVIFPCLAADEFQHNNFEQTQEYLSTCPGLQ